MHDANNVERKLPIKISLPDGFLNEEVRDGYTVSHKMKELWAIELDLLCEFMRVCEKNNITYYADAGTILGAARHKGFIPWDDDIDVMMMRDQYDTLCSIAEKEFKHPYFFQTEYTDPGSARGHAQLRNSMTTGLLEHEVGAPINYNLGIFMDIFPIDSIPDDKAKFESFHKKIYRDKKLYQMLIRYGAAYKKGSSKTPLATAVKTVLHYLLSGPLKDAYKTFYRRYEKDCTFYNHLETGNVAKLFDLPLNIKRRVWPRKDFDDVTYLPFEMLTIPVPSGYLDILEHFYGNWQKFVVGTSTHGGIIFDTTTPYKDYIRQHTGE